MTVAGQTNYIARDGMFTIKGWEVEGKLESNASVTVWTDGVTSNQSNKVAEVDNIIDL